MKTAIRSGRSWIPPEWRDPLGLRLWQRAAVVAVTGAVSRDHTWDILCGHLPLVPGHDDGPAAAEGQPPAPGEGPPGGGMEDAVSARRIARRLSRWRPASGVRELTRAGLLPAQHPAVYAWRSARPEEMAYRVWPDGSFTPLAVFCHAQQQDRDGQWRPHLAATRIW
ncbi:MAG TPA: hypothetical protein VGM53_35420 [Streptosporangiaceae bacterium]